MYITCVCILFSIIIHSVFQFQLFFRDFVLLTAGTQGVNNHSESCGKYVITRLSVNLFEFT